MSALSDAAGFMAILAGTQADLASAQGSDAPPEGAALDELIKATECRLQQLQTLEALAGTEMLFDGVRQVLEAWRDALKAVRAGDAARVSALAGDLQRKAKAIAFLSSSQFDLPGKIRAFRAQMRERPAGPVQ